ncbi:nucleosome assembly protein 1-like 1 [Topomyia yanbarensis]|uniref:nucleosome assembly protein 1-like 1 n=1 Tax=Topomyia yanbarensis TaxID=2498891 RepID=UPI00273B5B6A|nr:nucleosome assembly protein 1-like 1 [Topomyia yanbarensis]
MRFEQFQISFFVQTVIDKLLNSGSTASKHQLILCRTLDLAIKTEQLQAITMLPPNIVAKIDELRKIQVDLLNKEAEFHKQVHSMETEFQKTLLDMFDKRRQIINGTYLPTQEDTLKPEDNEINPEEQVKGIPEFWLNVFKMAPILHGLIHPLDEDALKHLVDVRAVMINLPKAGFVLEFEFEANDNFNNNVLTKRYEMECAPDAEKLVSFNGFEIIDSVGCDIDWKEGANLTVSIENGTERAADSFFNFFRPKKLAANVDPVTYKQFMEYDFEIGYFIKERIVPRAVLFYSGDVANAEDDSLEYDLETMPNSG